MDGTELVTGLFKKYPYLVLLGPLIGFYLSMLKDTGSAKGFKLLGLSVLIASGILCAFGLADGWAGEQWRQVPFVALVVVALSNLTTTTKQHVQDKLAEKKMEPTVGTDHPDDEG